MKASVDVLVIGGGIIGLTAAYELARAGLKVEVCDRGDLGREASWAGAGIIPPGNPAKAATPFDKLRAVSSSRFAEFTEALHESTGIDAGYRRCGGVEFLDKSERYALDLWQNEGIEFHEQPPFVITDSATPYYFPAMAQVRNPRFLKALLAACQSRGVILSPHKTIEFFGDRHAAVIYLIAAGAWSKNLLGPVGTTLGIHPVRGQMVQYRTTAINESRILIHGRRYIVPRGDGVILVGSTEEPEAGFTKETTRGGIEGLQHFAESLLPSLREATIERTWAGLRPGSRDGLPFIGFVPGYDNVLAAVGHFRSGIQLSLGTATMVADLILKRPPTVDPEPFRLDRPDEPAAKLAFRS